MDRIGAFLAELEELFEKHGMHIIDGSCGCCGHTSLIDTETKEVLTYTDDWEDERLRAALERRLL